MSLISISAAPKITDYLWYTFDGKRKVKFENSHKHYDLEIEPKERFGIKFGRKSIYLLHEDDPEIQFKLDPPLAKKLVEKSKGFKGKIKGKAVQPGVHGADAKLSGKPKRAPVHSAPLAQPVKMGEDKELTKELAAVRFPGLKRIEYILTQRPVPGEVYQYYDVSQSLLAYRRKHKIPVSEKGDWAKELEDTVESKLKGIDVEIGYVKHQNKIKHVLVVVNLE